jgi:hypothetical protein
MKTYRKPSQKSQLHIKYKPYTGQQNRGSTNIFAPSINQSLWIQLSEGGFIKKRLRL